MTILQPRRGSRQVATIVRMDDLGRWCITTANVELTMWKMDETMRRVEEGIRMSPPRGQEIEDGQA